MFDEVLMCVEYLDLAWTTELSELKFELDWRFLIEFGVDVESHWQFLDLQVNKGRNHMTKLRIYMDLCKCVTSGGLRLIDGFASLLREK